MGRADHGPVMDQKCKVQIDEETLHPDLSHGVPIEDDEHGDHHL